MITQLLQKIEADRIPCYFISPHLDDAVFSTGSLIARLSAITECRVITVFTESSTPLTLSARRFLKQSRINDANELFEIRRAEDISACAILGIRSAHLGYEDALFRKKSTGLLARIIPELGHTYPIYRLQISQGQVAKADDSVIARIETDLLKHIDTSRPYLVLAPLATGQHVDHVIIRNLCAKMYGHIVYWNDLPYSTTQPPDIDFITRHHLTINEWGIDHRKESAIKAYRTQWPIVFRGIDFMALPEQFAINHDKL
jgi:LmbE family N-acetylglucosaminyl deacetylase